MKDWQQRLSSLLLALGVALILAGLGLWASQTIIPEFRFRAADTDGDGIVLAARLEPESYPDAATVITPTPTKALKPTFTPAPAETPTSTPSADVEAATEMVPPGKTPTASPSPASTETPVPTSTPDTSSGPASTAAAEPPSRIVMPAINLDAPVTTMGWVVKEDANGQTYSEWVVPPYAAGWHKNSALPGQIGNTVLSGHHNIYGEVFRYLVDSEPGDRATLYVGETPYEYIVTEKYIVKEKGVSYEQRLKNAAFIGHTDDERLTLVSCWPYETNTHRVIVIARPVDELVSAQLNVE